MKYTAPPEKFYIRNLNYLMLYGNSFYSHGTKIVKIFYRFPDIGKTMYQQRYNIILTINNIF